MSLEKRRSLCRLKRLQPLTPSRRQCQRIDVTGTDPQLLIQDVRSQLSDAQRLDKSGERGWMLAPARVVQEKARERRAPIFQHPNQCSVREMRGGLLF